MRGAAPIVVVLLIPPGVGIGCGTVGTGTNGEEERRRDIVRASECGDYDCGSCAIFCVSDSGGRGCDYVARVYDVFCHDAVFSLSSLISLTSEYVELGEDDVDDEEEG